MPTISILGNIDDTVAMVEHIRESNPDSFIALAGISAGSGQVVSYIGREGSKTPVGAAASLCPAWDIREQLHCNLRRTPILNVLFLYQISL